MYTSWKQWKSDAFVPAATEAGVFEMYAELAAVGAAVGRGSVRSRWLFNMQNGSSESIGELGHSPKIVVVLDGPFLQPKAEMFMVAMSKVVAPSVHRHGLSGS